MKTILILHGIGGYAGIHWQKWLHDRLQKDGYQVLMPELPDAAHPDRKNWLKTVQATLVGINLSQLIIVGHSLGVTTALDFVEQGNVPVGGLIAVAGFASDYGADLNSYFLSEKTIDFKKVRKNLDWSIVIYGDDDPYVPQAALRYVADSLDARPIVITSGGHLNAEAGYTEFPKLLTILKKEL